METSEACCTLPVTAMATGYVAKGTYETIAGLKVYVTGDASASKGIIDVYDAFGISEPLLQGADLLAAATQAVVLVPDFFEGDYARESWFASSSEENTARIQQWWGSRASFDQNLTALERVAAEVKMKYPSVQGWGAFGLCWGGKICALASFEGTPFKVTGQTHPGRLAAEDAEKIVIPHMVLASKDENAEVVAEYDKILTRKGVPNVVEVYSTMHHGWMGARAKLPEEEFKKEYERGYEQTAAFFAKHL